MSDNKYKSSSSVPSNPTEKLLRDTQLSKGSKASSNEASDTKSVSEISELQLPSMERLGPGTSCDEKYLEGSFSSQACSNELKEPQEGGAFRPRMLVVSNRLPFSAVRIEGSWSLDISAGGPVTALLGLKEFEVRYVGWAGIHVSDEAEQKSLTEVLTEKRCIPVFIDEVIFRQYYNGYCNNILWSLFHYLGSSQEDGPATTISYQSQFDAYREANKIFADVVIKHYKEGDVVCCHDYHLMFLPKYLKEHNSEMEVGWFLHTPFPPSEAHRTLPSRSELLHALLSADLLGTGQRRANRAKFDAADEECETDEETLHQRKRRLVAAHLFGASNVHTEAVNLDRVFEENASADDEAPTSNTDDVVEEAATEAADEAPEILVQEATEHVEAEQGFDMDVEAHNSVHSDHLEDFDETEGVEADHATVVLEESMATHTEILSVTHQVIEKGEEVDQNLNTDAPENIAPTKEAEFLHTANSEIPEPDAENIPAENTSQNDTDNDNDSSNHSQQGLFESQANSDELREVNRATAEHFQDMYYNRWAAASNERFHMSDNKYKSSSSVPSNPTEKLLRDTQLSKGSKASSNEASDTKSVSEISELQLPSMERLGPGTSCDEKYLEGSFSSQACSNELKEPQEGGAFRPRMLVVSNRLPFSAVRIEGSWSLDISAGGPVTALLGLKEFEVRYVGWAGIHVSDEAEQKSLTEVLTEKRCIPVFIDEVIFRQYYNGYCNNILWSLFHYLGSSQEDGPATTISYQSQFDAYREANKIFADVVIKHYKEGDVVCCHDYHLMFLPKYLKEHNSQMEVGWFLHTPFPPSEAHRTLPSRSELLHALLSADLLGTGQRRANRAKFDAADEECETDEETLHQRKRRLVAAHLFGASNVHTEAVNLDRVFEENASADDEAPTSNTDDVVEEAATEAADEAPEILVQEATEHVEAEQGFDMDVEAHNSVHSDHLEDFDETEGVEADHATVVLEESMATHTEILSVTHQVIEKGEEVDQNLNTDAPENIAPTKEAEFLHTANSEIPEPDAENIPAENTSQNDTDNDNDSSNHSQEGLFESQANSDELREVNRATAEHFQDMYYNRWAAASNEAIRFHMSDNKYKSSSSVPSNPTEKLLRDTQLSKGSKASSNEASDTKSVSEISELQLPSMERLGPGTSCDEKYLEGSFSSQACSNELKEPQEGGAFRPRMLVVSNRLPFSAVRIEGSWSLDISAGGPVTALLGLKEFEVRYVGWAGIHVSDEAEQKSLTEVLTEKRCIPVFIDEVIFRQYYNGYCNNILWSLFHYLGSSQEDGPATTISYQSQFDAYREANKIFADVVIKHYKEGDVVCCHDYHLMFLPKYLKEHNSQMEVGWFLHTPFPPSEAHRTLPSRSELLHALLSADLLGFHTFDYARHFVSTCTRILGVEASPAGIEYQGRLTRVAVFPMGIDSDRFFRALETPKVRECINEFTEKFSGRKVILGVDRLDMVKGIPQKLLAFEKFLEDNKDLRDEVILLQIAVPRRTDIPEYQKFASKVHTLVGRINGRFGTLSKVPLIHLDQPLKFHTLCALYAVTDVALVTSLRDGMNLVSYEFVACQGSKKGVLVLSEFAGAAQSLGAGAILINPWDIAEVASSIGRALNMKDDERKKRHELNFQQVITHTSQKWAEAFVRELGDAVIGEQQRIKGVPPALPVTDAIEHYLQSNNRLLVLGFNAVLTEPVDTPDRRGEDQRREVELKLNPDLKSTLMELCCDPKTTIVVLSGSNKFVLDNNFCEYKMWLAAENGNFLRSTTGKWMTTIPENLNLDWIDCIKPVFEYFTERTPQSQFELRYTSLVWNYKYADVKFGRVQAIDLLQHLCESLSNAHVDVIQGSRSVEVRAGGVTKGAGIHRILEEIAYNSVSTQIDYVLCIGHFLGKDEDLYTYFEPELPAETPRTKTSEALKFPGDRMSDLKLQNSGSVSKASHVTSEQPLPNSGKKTLWNVLDLMMENYFSCTVDRTQSRARYSLGSSDDVVSLLKALAAASSSS